MIKGNSFRLGCLIGFVIGVFVMTFIIFYTVGAQL